MTENKRFIYVYFEDGTEMIEDYRKEYITDMEEATEMLNQLVDENELLKFELKECRENKLFSRRQLEKENEQLKQELFEVKKDYLIETADISDKIYLDDMIEELRREMIVKDGGRLI